METELLNCGRTTLSFTAHCKDGDTHTHTEATALCWTCDELLKGKQESGGQTLWGHTAGIPTLNASFSFPALRIAIRPWHIHVRFSRYLRPLTAPSSLFFISPPSARWPPRPLNQTPSDFNFPQSVPANENELRANQATGDWGCNCVCECTYPFFFFFRSFFSYFFFYKTED